GPAAPLGQLDYVVKGAMIGGFALIAAPAEYRVSGVKTFMVSQDGVVWEKDLGPNTLELANKIELLNPDTTWHPVQEHESGVAEIELSIARLWRAYEKKVGCIRNPHLSSTHLCRERTADRASRKGSSRRKEDSC